MSPYAGYTTKDVECYPLAAAGPTVASLVTAWAWNSTWTQLVPVSTIAVDFVITHFIALEDPVAAVDARHQVVFQIGTGTAGSEVVRASIPVTYLIDSAVGHLAPWIFPLAIPRQIAANSRVAIRVTDSIAAIRTYGGCKIVYIRLPY